MSLEESTVGQAINLMSNDVNKFDTGLLLIHYAWISPMMSIAITYLMWLEIGFSCLFGVFVVIMIIPVQGSNDYYKNA